MDHEVAALVTWGGLTWTAHGRPRPSAAAPSETEPFVDGAAFGAIATTDRRTTQRDSPFDRCSRATRSLGRPRDNAWSFTFLLPSSIRCAAAVAAPGRSFSNPRRFSLASFLSNFQCLEIRCFFSSLFLLLFLLLLLLLFFSFFKESDDTKGRRARSSPLYSPSTSTLHALVHHRRRRHHHHHQHHHHRRHHHRHRHWYVTRSGRNQSNRSSFASRFFFSRERVRRVRDWESTWNESEDCEAPSSDVSLRSGSTNNRFVFRPFRQRFWPCRSRMTELTTNRGAPSSITCYTEADREGRLRCARSLERNHPSPPLRPPFPLHWVNRW